MRLSLSLVVLALGAGCSGSSSASKGCTEIGCVSGLSVSLGAGAKTAGSYVVDVDADGKKTRCQATLPLPACGAQPAPCDSDAVLLELSGCALPASEHAITGLQLRAAPAKVTITVSRDNQQLATQSFSPSYTTSTPNGPDCPPVCTQASASMAVP